jgi:ABC-type nitrate/sulfonate/bicarbonate transport system substrate-binding protein
MKPHGIVSANKTGYVQAPVRARPLRIGFMPVSDCAPLVYAQASGLFDKYELKVELRRETRWADIRDRVIWGELEAAQAPAPLPFLANLGLESDLCACVSGLVLSLQGNAIAVSRPLWNEGVRDARTLRDLIYRNWGRRTYTFGLVLPYSPPHFLLRQWLKSGGIDPQFEMRLAVVPSVEMFPALKLGYLDGFCASEPWVSLAVEAGAAMRVATSGELAPRHPEKVLMVRRDFAEARASEHERLLAALLEACAFCDQPENQPLLVELLAQPQYVNVPASCLARSLAEGGHLFHRHQANDPSNEKAAWVLSQLYELAEESVYKLPFTSEAPMLKNVFRRDIYQRARAAITSRNDALKREAEDYDPGARQAG